MFIRESIEYRKDVVVTLITQVFQMMTCDSNWLGQCKSFFLSLAFCISLLFTLAFTLFRGMTFLSNLCIFYYAQLLLILSFVKVANFYHFSTVVTFCHFLMQSISLKLNVADLYITLLLLVAIALLRCLISIPQLHTRTMLLHNQSVLFLSSVFLGHR